MPEKSKTISNLSLLSPYLTFSKWASKPSKNQTENISVKTKSTSITISPKKIKNNFSSENIENNENNEIINFENSENVCVGAPGSADSILPLRMSLKDFVFIYTTITQLLAVQKKENKIKIISLKEKFYLFFSNFRDIENIPLLTDILVCVPMGETAVGGK